MNHNILKMDIRDNLLVCSNFHHINKSLISLNSTIVDTNEKVKITLGITLLLGIIALCAILTAYIECIRACRSSNTRIVENFK